ncbi:hypothetical protein [Paraburkholderia caledonica]|uniref:hypothetical protein n=1 Tax=Paraburkholderia caledonica TaxID=134536 RepID=UPI001177F947|nr:hypothetical protein [Paraburkholderia caledonica]
MSSIKTKPNLTINTSSVTQHSSTGSSEPLSTSPSARARNPALAALPPSPTSPRASAGRLFLVAKAAQKFKGTGNVGVETKLQPKLEAGKAHKDVAFQEGGGFVVKSTYTKKFSPDEMAQRNADHQAKLAKHEADVSAFKEQNPQLEGKKLEKALGQQKLGSAPKPPKPTRPLGSNEVEYHPPGGIHSLNQTDLPGQPGEFGGSYARVKRSDGGSSSEFERLSRFGKFGDNQTIEGKPLGGQSRADPSTIRRQAPERRNSEPPSPATAQAVLDKYYNKPVETMKELESGKPYKDIAQASSLDE